LPVDGRAGRVLIVGVGRIGSRVARELAKEGVDLVLLDPQLVEEKNVDDQEYEKDDVGYSKAERLAARLSGDTLRAQVTGERANFLELDSAEQLLYISSADVVVAATDNDPCQRRINDMCLRAEVRAVYPGIWDHPGARPGEVGEVVWVMPGRHTPCYRCAMQSLEVAGEVSPQRGASYRQVTPLVHVTVQAVRALLEPTDPDSFLIPEEHAQRDPPPNVIYVHGFNPVSPSLVAAGRSLFDRQRPLGNRYISPGYQRGCPHCGRLADDTTRRRRAEPLAIRPGLAWWSLASIVMLIGLVIFVPLLFHNQTTDRPTPTTREKASTTTTEPPVATAPAPQPTAATPRPTVQLGSSTVPEIGSGSEWAYYQNGTMVGGEWPSAIDVPRGTTQGQVHGWAVFGMADDHPSTTEYDLGRRFTQFIFVAGLDDGSPANARVKFDVYVDNELRSSVTVGPVEEAPVRVDVAGGVRLLLTIQELQAQRSTAAWNDPALA
jgi:molybdopterin/thiamine biosynthesis adenylyltransferase